MRFILSLILFLCVAENVKCQSDSIKLNKYRNTVTCEVFGHSNSLISANYERLLKPIRSSINFSVRLGVGYSPGSHDDSSTRGIARVVTIPFAVSFLLGRKHHFAQLGIGYTASFEKENYIDSTFRPPVVHQKFESAYIISLGYRYVGNGFLIQGFPLIQWTNNPSNRFSIGFGFSIGGYF